mgnify:CR=1 FL=1
MRTHSVIITPAFSYSITSLSLLFTLLIWSININVISGLLFFTTVIFPITIFILRTWITWSTFVNYPAALFMSASKSSLRKLIANQYDILVYRFSLPRLNLLPWSHHFTIHRFVGIIVKESHEFCTKFVWTTLRPKEFVIWGKDLGKTLLHLSMPVYELGFGNESTHIFYCGLHLFLVHKHGNTVVVE